MRNRAKEPHSSNTRRDSPYQHIADETKPDPVRFNKTRIGLVVSFCAGLVFFVFHRELSLLANDRPLVNDRRDKDPPHTFHDWTKMESWLCPGRVPNLTAAVVTFRVAQQILGLNNKNRSSSAFPRDNDIKAYYSMWPGHVLLRERNTNKTAAILRTYKCGSETIEEYFDQIGRRNAEKRADWNDFVRSEKAQKSECILTAYRDPMEHFFSGLGELEMRRTKDIRRGNIPDQHIASYERLDLLSADRLVSFVEFLFGGEWFERLNTKGQGAPFHWLDFGHVFPQTGYLVWLQSINRTVSAYTSLANLTGSIPTLLEEYCGLPRNVLPPIVTIKLHDKVAGLSSVHKKLWANGSEKALAGTFQLPLLHALCLFHAVDYACLAPELKVPPPEVCARAFETYLSV
jgi:hypothetical protein